MLPFQLDRQVGNAAAGVEPMRRSDRAGRAGVDAALCRIRSGPTCGGSDRQFERGENFREEKPGARAGGLSSMVLLPCQTDPGLGGKIAFQHRTGIDVKLSAVPPSCGRESRPAPQFLPATSVVIVAPGVAGDASAPSLAV